MSGTIEDWCRALLGATTLADKLTPGPRPESFAERGEAGDSVATLEPVRPGGLRVGTRAERLPKALHEISARVRLLHLFLHHEVQAAELFAWAVLRFPDTPEEFRRGLLRLVDDELRHARLYEERVRELGGHYGAHAVRDWFWVKARLCTEPRMFVALMGLGFEGANLEHAERFEAALLEEGDADSAKILNQVGREEVSHVRFAARWFTHFDGGDSGSGPDYERWAAALPAPLTPSLMRGSPLQREARGRAGLSRDFLDRLEAAGRVTTGASPRRDEA